MPLTGLICLIIYLYIKCKYTISVLQVYFLPSTIALFFIYLQKVTSMFKCSTVLSCTMNNFGTYTRFFTSDLLTSLSKYLYRRGVLLLINVYSHANIDEA